MFKSIFTSTILYSLVGILPSIVGFLLLPLFLTVIPAEQYGIYVLINSFSTILGVIMGLKLESAYRVFFFEQNDKKKYLGILFTSILMSSTLISLVTILFGDLLFKKVFGADVKFFPYGLLAVINIFIGSINILYAIDCQNREKRKAYVWYALAASFLSISIQYLGIIVFKHGILSFFVAALITGVVQFGYILSTGKFTIIKIERSIINESLRYSLPLIPFLFLLTAEQQIDRFFLKKYHSLELLGIYALLLTASGFFSVLINSLDNALRPRLFQSLKMNDPVYNVNQYQKIYVSIALVAVAGVVLLSYVLPHWIGNLKYLPLLKSIPLFAMSLIPLVYVRYYAVLFSYKKDSKNLIIIGVIKLIVLILVFRALVPAYGIDGVLLSLFIANLLNALLFFMLVKYKHKLVVSLTFDLAVSTGITALLFIFWTQS
jgi:O-antigen/teichoic acid export membrane protein